VLHVDGQLGRQEVEERSVSLISSLLTNLGPRGGRRERVGAKFVEAEFEKTDRLMEIYFRCITHWMP
jgi:beta-catenin-like protein 1